MKLPLLLGSLIVAASLVSCATTSAWNAAHIKEVRFREGIAGKQIRVVTDQNEIKELVGCLKRATEVGKSSDRKNAEWTASFYLVGEPPERGHWLYNLEKGEFAFLDPISKPVYQLKEADRAKVNAWFQPLTSSPQIPPAPP